MKNTNDTTSFQSFTDDHCIKISKIAKKLVADHKLTAIDSFNIAVEIHRNIILEQALCASGTKTPNPLEMIALKLKDNV